MPGLLARLKERAEHDLLECGLRYREAVIVDDGSTDATFALIEAAAKDDPRIVAVREWERNRGKGAAIRAGIQRASQPLILLADVDLSTPLTDARRLVEALDAGADLAIGSREAGDTRVIAPRHRRVLGFGFNRLVKTLTGLDISDTQAGFKLIGAADGKRLVADQLSSGFAYDVELLMRAQQAGLVISEVPVSYVHAPGSKVRVLGSGIDMATDLVRLSIARRRGRLR